ncbi:MAG: hypothetical protein R3C53_25715 [Pirellulaceae bacterium]
MDSALSTRDSKCEPTSHVKKRDLSRDCMQLLELMQRINFGRIEGLQVVNGEPVLSSIKSARSVHKLKGENGPRPELGIADFSLKQEVCELFRLIERVGNGELDLIEIKHGLPFIVELNEVPA